MPIYEFYCPECHMIFSFFSRSVNTGGRPSCPRCGRKKLPREVSLFAMGGEAGEEEGADIPLDEARMEEAVSRLAGEADGMNEDDPQQAASLMRKFTRMTGMELGDGMKEALARMEAGEDPEVIESEMGDLLENEDPFLLPGKRGGAGRQTRRRAPRRDEKLYEM